MRVILLLALGLLFFGCIGETITVKNLADSPADYVGKEIAIKGTVTDAFKLGKLSGYTLKDGNSSIKVSARRPLVQRYTCFFISRSFPTSGFK